MSKIALIKCPEYGSPAIEQAVARAVDLLGGMGALVRPGQLVLLKPNLLGAYSPERRVTTDPALVIAVGRLVLAAGGRVVIADSPALEPFGRVAVKSGLAAAAKALGAEIAELSQPISVPPQPGALYKGLELARLALEADVIINLPKLKTHGQMLLSLGVKNLFGTVVAQRKSEWHHMAGVDRISFASLLLDIHQALKPALTILDGVWGMEGQGPSNGLPRHLGLIAAATDALALDVAVCRLLGAPLSRFPLYRAAQARGLLTPGVENPALVGDPLDDLRVQDFQLPELQALGFLPRRLDWFTRRYLVSRPVADAKACQRCGQCLSICPAHGMTLTGPAPSIDYNSCIRCYCCQEVCPHNAIALRRGLLARLLVYLGR